MKSIYLRVSRIFTLRQLFHVRYPCLTVHLLIPSIIQRGGRDRACSEMHLEARID
jgi:hypothetical protein